MNMKEKVTLNKKEQKRLMVMNQVEAGRMRGWEAAELLALWSAGMMIVGNLG